MAGAAAIEEPIKTPLAESLPTDLAKDAKIVLPEPQAAQVALPPGSKGAELIVTMDDATKLSVGLHLDIATYISRDNGQKWEFVNGCGWDSYGAKGWAGTIGLDGAPLINPDPRLILPVADKNGALIRVEVTAKQAATIKLAMSALA